jgi:hypothetical protein
MRGSIFFGQKVAKERQIMRIYCRAIGSCIEGRVILEIVVVVVTAA